MFAINRRCLAVSLFVVAVLGCERSQPLEPVPEITAASSGGGAGPAAPSGTVALPVAYSQINVSWTDNSTDELGFEVFRSTTGSAGPFTRLITTGANVAAYVDRRLNATTQYCYEVRAFRMVNSKPKYSAFSAATCATTPIAAPPAAPGPLSAITYPWQIILSWSATMVATEGFIIERCEGTQCADSDFVVIAVIPFMSYQDFSGVQGVTYTYRVRAFNSAGQSAPSNEATATQCIVEEGGDGTYFCTEAP